MRIELDSHVDITVLSRNCVILTYTGKERKLSPYSDEYESIQHVPVVTRSTAWTRPHSGETSIIVFDEALWMGDKLDQILVNPKQMRHHFIKVQDNPWMQNLMVITCSQEDVTIPLYI